MALLPEAIEKVFELGKEKAELEITIRDAKNNLEWDKAQAIVNGIGQEGKNAETREALLLTHLMSLQTYSDNLDAAFEAAAKLMRLAPELEYWRNMVNFYQTTLECEHVS